MKRSLLLLIGGGVLVVLIGALILVQHLPKKETKAPETITLSKIDKSKIDKIALKHGGDTVTLLQKGGKFVADYPYDVAWDSSGIDQVVDGFTSLDADRMLSKNPTDLSQYGLQSPAGTAIATLTDGTQVTLSVGSKTPSGSDYYIMKSGDPALYTASSYNVDPLLDSYDSLRDKSLPSIDTKKLTYYKITSGGRTIEIVPMSKDEPLANIAFSGFKITSPYSSPRAADGDKLEKVLQAFPSYLEAQQFVTDHPTNAQLSSFGLAPPVTHIVLKDDKDTLDILLGKQLPGGDTLYAKLADKPSVFTVNDSDFKPILDATLFDLTDKFLLIPNIDNVDGFEVKTPSTTYAATLTRTPAPKSGSSSSSGDNNANDNTTTTYTLNGKSIEEGKFKNFYQDVIGLLADSPNPKPNIAFKPEITITFHLNKGTTRSYSEYLVPAPGQYNRDFYAVYLNGVADMLLDRSQVQKMVSDANDLLSGSSSSSSGSGS